MEAIYYICLKSGRKTPRPLAKFTDTLENGLEALQFYPRLAADRRAMAWLSKSIRAQPRTWAQSIATSFVAYDTEFLSRQTVKSAELLVLSSANYHSVEVDPLAKHGCLLCGFGYKRAQVSGLEPTSTINGRIGFTNAGRLVAHVDMVEAMLAMGLRGFDPLPLPSEDDDKHLLRVWCGDLEGAREYTFAALPNPAPGVRVVEGEESVFLVVTKATFRSGLGAKAHRVLKKFEAADDISYHAIPPGRALGRRKSARWLELVVEEPRLQERECNKYDQRYLCPLCGEGGLSPKGVLKIRRESWNDADFCLTDVGRLCVTPRVVRFLERFGGVRGEPVKFV